ncbi:uncharacterized protein LOC119434027 isoform X9 [Dermacentor silvarum]|uniref:uncharacterized protein LOC119434027 isoform X9 n=1 Tax=Dermacentor silvarum TaxID=543639 RepID=UPI0021012BAA|nr:uncharacterized protein LOC119434027 isoform X9 [Dermacentor silvarum]
MDHGLPRQFSLLMYWNSCLSLLADYTPLLDIPKEQGASPPLNTKGECGSEIVNGDQDGVAAFEQAEGAVKPKKRKVSSSVRCDPTVMELCEILSDLVRLEAFLCEYGLGIAPPPPPSEALLTQPKLLGRPCRATQIWGTCSVLKFNPLLPDCKGRITTCIRKGVKGGRPAYRCSCCGKQVGVFKLKFKGSDRDPFLILGLLAESTGELRLLHIADNDPDCVAQIVAKGVLPETKIFSSGGKEFSHIEAAKDEDGPMRLVHNTGSQNDGATTKSRSKRPNSFCNTQKILCLWRRVRSKLVMIGSSKDPTALQGYLDWFWWLSLNGIGHCKDPFLRLLEAIAKAYGE